VVKMLLLGMEKSDVKIINQERVYDGYFKIDRYRLKHRLFAGGWSDELMRELIVRHDAVAVLLYDPKLDKVVLIEQFRIAAINEENPWLLEIVAGIIDKDNSKDEIARFEAQEEAGLEIEELIPICEYWSSPGGTSETVKLFCGIVDASEAGGIHGLAEEHEDILVHVLDSKEAFAGVESGRINNAATIIALQWLEIRRVNAKLQR